MTQSKAVSFEWFAPKAAPNAVIVDNAVTVGVINEAEDGVENCGGPGGKAWIAAAANLWGYTSGPQLLCDLGFKREVKGSTCTATPSGADNRFFAPDNATSRLDNFYKRTLGNDSLGIDSIAVGGKYRLYYDSFIATCLPSSVSYTIQTFAAGSSAPSGKSYKATSVQGKDGGTNVRLYQNTDISCKDLAAKIDKANDPAVLGYIQYLIDNAGNTEELDASGCSAGAVTDAAGNPCTPGGASSCAIDGLGWLLCPILTLGAGLADSAYGFLANSFLATDPSLVNTDPNATVTTKDANGNPVQTKVGTGTYTAWKIMQGIGNVAFIIAVLIIIFSQLTSAGISNYGVKKLLPRVIVAAILVNLSFLICQIAVDLSNILGYSLKGLLEGVAQQVKDAGGGAAAPTGDQSGNLLGITTVVLAAGSASLLNVGAVIVAVVGAIIVLLTIFVLLIARKVLIVLLIVIAPLAFVAFLLPNTEPLFQKWLKMLTSLLLLYPVIGLLYGASILASAVLLQIAGGDTVLQIAAYMALVLPLIAVIPLLKGSLNGIGKLGGAINSFGAKAQGVGKGAAQKGFDRSRLGQFEKYRKGAATRRRAQRMGGASRGSNKNPLNWAHNARAAGNRVLNSASGNFGSELGATGASLADEETERSVKSATALMTQQQLTSGELHSLAMGNEVRRNGKVLMQKPNESMRQAAVREKMRSGTTREAEQILIGSKGASDRVRQEMARGIHSNGHNAKADYLGGDFADRVLRGEITSEADIDDAAARRLDTGQLSSEKMVSQDADTLDRFARVGSDASAGVRTDIAPARLAEVAAQALGVLTNPQLNGKVSGQQHNFINTITTL
ncbi:hypothetical protein [Rhodoglobus vestalii]|nr:hypothetical protein [Rhodoglobus vestalii]